MKITRTIGKALKPLVNVSAWVGYRQLADTAKSIGSSVKGLFSIPVPEHTETFEQAMERLNLTEDTLIQRKKEFSRILIIHLVIAFLIFAYTFYLGWQGSIHGAIAGFAITLLVLARAFRYHFWLFQLKKRKLGCTFRERLDSTFTGK